MRKPLSGLPRDVSTTDQPPVLVRGGSSHSKPTYLPTSPLSFQILKTSPDTHARLGVLVTPHGSVQTPAFLPVGTQGTVKAMTVQDLETLGVEMVLANAYHLYLRPGVERIVQAGGLHRFMGWSRPILTDSGGFQVFSLSALRKITDEGVEFQSHIDGSRHFLTPEHMTEAQLALGADVIMCLDECVPYPCPEAYTEQALERTLTWAVRCRAVWEASQAKMNPLTPVRAPPRTAIPVGGPTGPPPTLSPEGRGDKARSFFFSSPPAMGRGLMRSGGPLLFGIVQGGMFPHLRRLSAAQTVALDFPGYAIGGLSVGEPRPLREALLGVTVEGLPAEKPRYLMGVGSPEDLWAAVADGVDLFDCVLPTRNARNGQLFTSQGKLNIKNSIWRASDEPVDLACDCELCSRHTRAFLHHLFRVGELTALRLATLHNVRFLIELMRIIRHAIANDRYQEARASFLHPFKEDL